MRAAPWMVSASVAVWVSEPEVPVKVMVGAADAVVIGAVNVTLAEDVCADVGESVNVDWLAETPEERPEMETAIEPVKELSAEEVMVTALLVAPAFSESKAGETVREKSAVGLGVELPPQERRSRDSARAAGRRSALWIGRMGVKRARR